MSPTLHKILYYAADVIRKTKIPIGLLSEEPSEANNKVLRYIRLHNTRKISRETTMTDLSQRLYEKSDPRILEKYLKKL